MNNILSYKNINILGLCMEKETEAVGGKPAIDAEKFLNSVVTVSVKDGRKFRGKLIQYDEHMNLLLEDAEELSAEGPTAKYKLILLKGGNVTDLSI